MTTTESTEYDAMGRSVKQIDVLGRVTTTEYSTDGLTTTVTTPAGATFVTTSNPDGSPQSISGTGQRAQQYSYDINGKNIATTVRLTNNAILSQDIVNGFGQTVVQGQPNTLGVFIYTRSEYNAKGQSLSSAQKQLISQLNSTLEGKIISVSERGLTSTQWSVYNEATKRLQYSAAPTSAITAETVMVSGFALLQEVAGEITVYQASALNQYAMLSVDDITDFIPSYDAAGNQTRVKTSTGIWAISYDAENRPTDFTSQAADGTITTVHCEYDYMGRRATKQVTTNGSITLHQRYIYRGYLQVACIDLTRSHHPALWYITWDATQPVATRPLAIQKDGTWYTYGWDLTKNICEVYGPAGYIRTAYTYTPYGAVTAAGDVTQPIQWSCEYNDTESGLIYYNYRHYNPVDGRWTGRDRLSFATDGNPYCFIFNKSHAIDILGLYLYAIEGTSYDLAGDSNVARMYHLYKYIADFPFNLFGETAHYIPGTQSAVRGSDCVDISERLLTRICEDFCNNHKAGRTVPIDIVGWSRGAAIAIDVTIQLSIRGCQCCDEIHHPKVNWLGLFDPVDMTLPFSGRELQTGHIPDIVKSGTIIYATDRTLTYSGGLLDFIPVMPQDEFSRMTSVYLPTATHNDIGGEGNHDRNRNATSLLIMIQSLMSSYTK